jgi:uncharacterized protein (TIGR02246 family)
VSELRALVERYLETFNTRDLDAWAELFHDDVEVTGDGGPLRGREEARAFTARTVRRYPGIRAELVRVVAEAADTIVVEYRLANPDEQTSGWRLDGTVCAIYDVRDGRIAASRTYYLPGERDRTDAASLPSRVEAARIAEERAALGRVASLVAQGVSEDRLFAAVDDEVAQLVGADATAMLRFEPDDTVTLVAAWSAIEGRLPIGERRPVDDTLRSLRANPRPLRFEPGELPATGPFVEEAQQHGISTSVGVPVEVAGRVWGVCFAAATGEESFQDDTEARIAGFTELVATAIANAESHAELSASRARVVAAADETRRRIQRDVHDGAQQRLVHAIITLKQLKRVLDPGGGPEADLVDEALARAGEASVGLRELVRGIMPAALTQGGLSAGVHALADNMDLRVNVEVLPGRLPTPVETTAYFIVAEALTNTVKHADATSARVFAACSEGKLELELSDDGVGGADRTRGTGLVGLIDRVAAMGGRIVITSPPGAGTTLAVTLPLRQGRSSAVSRPVAAVA